MPYEAVSAYTVVIGETGAATSVTVHGSADEAWRALSEAVRGRSSRWLPRNADAAELADRWRAGAPERRFWQVSAHQLQVMMPAAGDVPQRCGARQPPAPPPAAPRWRRRNRGAAGGATVS
jgi:hypothetical protein